VKEEFDFRATAHLPSGERYDLHVKVKGTVVSLHDSAGLVAAGVWDAGRYVRYARSQEIPAPPQILDEIDRELRQRLRIKGVQARVNPPRGSSVGYGDY
jgi:hypothetical protein